MFVFVAAAALLINLPIILMVLGSFRTTDEIMSSQSLWPEVFTLVNYEYVSARTAFWLFMTNSMIIALVSTIASLIAGLFAGYALSRFRSRWLEGYSTGLFVIQMLPVILSLIPLFLIFKSLGLINHPLSVILVYSMINLPFATTMAKQFFDTIPRELEEACMIDGSTQFGAFWRVVLPLSGPGIASIAIYSFLHAYNEYFIAAVFLRNEDAMTLPVAIQLFMQQDSADWGKLFAAATMTLIPTLVLFFAVQRFMVSGGLAGGVKG